MKAARQSVLKKIGVYKLTEEGKRAVEQCGKSGQSGFEQHSSCASLCYFQEQLPKPTAIDSVNCYVTNGRRKTANEGRQAGASPAGFQQRSRFPSSASRLAADGKGSTCDADNLARGSYASTSKAGNKAGNSEQASFSAEDFPPLGSKEARGIDEKGRQGFTRKKARSQQKKSVRKAHDTVIP